MQKASIATYAGIALAVLIAAAAALGWYPSQLTPAELAAVSAIVTALAGLAHAKTDKAPPEPPAPPQP